MFIEILPAEVRSKIAAGEVIESPSDAVKELIENSLDAGATQVEVELFKGGKRLICIRDNGSGIHPLDVEKAILQGATSKIRTEKDLLSLKSYGFRGEALHALANVSRLTLRSRFFQEKLGREMVVEEGRVLRLREVGMPVGTEVEVRDLFYNLPARRKFLKREDTERRKVAQLVEMYALANPSVGFSLFSNGRKILNLRPSDPKTRVEEVFSKRFEFVEESEAGISLKAYLSRNVPQGKVYLFVNSRPVFSRSLTEYMRKIVGYKTLIVLFLEVPPFMVDFNIHPKKREVRFLQERKILSFLKDSLTSGEEVFGSLLAQEVPKYEEDFKVIGQIKETIILVQRGDYLYFLDQHLISERYNYERFGTSPEAEELACRHAIKAGKSLTKEEMEKLLSMWRSLENPHVCPHGRPIYYRLPLKEIYEKLGRNY